LFDKLRVTGDEALRLARHFGVLKTEYFYLNRFDSVEQLQKGIDHYNHEAHQALKLKGLSPVQYRTQALSTA